MLEATLHLKGTLEDIERALSLLLAGENITKVQMQVEAPLNEAERRLMTPVPVPPPPTEEPSEAEQAAIEAQEQVLSPGKRKHRKKEKLLQKAEKKAEPAPSPETPPEAAPSPETPSANGKDDTLPDLETLKGLVVNAVKVARAGGDGKILGLLPAFKKSTGLPFVMEAKDEHRPALYDLINKAGIAIE